MVDWSCWGTILNNMYWFAFIPIALAAPFVSGYFTWMYYDYIHWPHFARKYGSGYADIIKIEN